jgi:hypothetical protein
MRITKTTYAILYMPNRYGVLSANLTPEKVAEYPTLEEAKKNLPNFTEVDEFHQGYEIKPITTLIK